MEVALNGAIPACRTHGTIVNVAVWEKRPAIRVNDLMYKEVNYMGAALYDNASFEDVIKAISYGKSYFSVNRLCLETLIDLQAN